MNLNRFKKLTGDASFRNFFRNKKNQSIIVYSKKDKYKNLLIYEAINRLLNDHKINSPRLIRQNYKNNIIEINDLGNLSFLKKFRKFKIKNYEELFKILEKLKNIKQKKVKTMIGKVYKIPIYTEKLLFKETKLFSQWYIPRKSGKFSLKIKKEFNFIIKKLIKRLKTSEKIFVHRDFHVSNILIYKNDFFLIDNQDAVYGNQAYDLASLIDDVRIKISFNKREKLYSKFLQKKQINKNNFRNDFEILSILRNLKIIGIFTRLSERDNKHSYIKMIPYAWKIIDGRRKSNPHIQELNKFLEKYFHKDLGIKNEN